MCQGCEDFREYERLIDTYVAKELPKIMAEPLNDSVLYGEKH